ncbi:hypothetical protein LSH36_406g02061 [Paralvinella palmiformis]|uniref:Uncharacterized protein n=1 Tax=Paralvinella palmiformis TaxID=53620 RepID=A0AAD9JDN1_9ANNE|nr:hypothetical protein LSH36_406g02061 [Paralvinella palmiformis]
MMSRAGQNAAAGRIRPAGLRLSTPAVDSAMKVACCHCQIEVYMKPKLAKTKLTIFEGELSPDQERQVAESQITNKSPQTTMMYDETRQLLKDFFLPYNRRLAQLLGELSPDQERQVAESQITNKSPQTTMMYDETRQLLKDFFLPYNRRLAQLLGDPAFSWGY